MPRGTTLRNFRVADELWSAAQRTAKQRDENLSADVIRPALEAYVEQNAITPAPAWWEQPPYTVACPRCDARPGTACVGTYQGVWRGVAPHLERVDLAG